MSITTGYLDQTMLIVPENQDNWADLGSAPYGTWSSWTTWCSDPSDIVVTFTDDIGAVEYRTPLLTLIAEGDVSSIELDISTTGSFTGEETNIPFVSGTEYDYPQGRYFRWTITIQPTVDVPVPFIRSYGARYNQEYVTEYLDDYDIYSATSTGLTPALDTQLGFVKHMQATAHKGYPYVEDGYVLDTEPFRTEVSVSNNGVILVGGTPFSSTDNSLDFGTPSGYIIVDDSAVVPACVTEDLITIETWVYYTSLSGTFDKTILEAHNPLITPRQSQFKIHMMYTGSQFQIRITDDSFGNLDSTVPVGLAVDTWYHVAYTWDGTTSRLFVDGVLSASTTTAPSFTNANSRFVVGGVDTLTGAADLTGYLSGFRISKSALYTATFTPPQSMYANETTTVFFLRDAIEDENGFDSGSDPYIIDQQGGIAQIESKNPPKLVVLDYNGVPWDGTVDVTLTGLRKIIRTVDGVGEV